MMTQTMPQRPGAREALTSAVRARTRSHAGKAGTEAAIEQFWSDARARALLNQYERVGYRKQGVKAMLLWTAWTEDCCRRGFLVLLQLARGGRVERQHALIAATVVFDTDPAAPPCRVRLLEGRGLQAVSRWVH